jgi:hypothetical protein
MYEDFYKVSERKSRWYNYDEECTFRDYDDEQNELYYRVPDEFEISQDDRLLILSYLSNPQIVSSIPNYRFLSFNNGFKFRYNYIFENGTKEMLLSDFLENLKERLDDDDKDEDVNLFVDYLKQHPLIDPEHVFEDNDIVIKAIEEFLDKNYGFSEYFDNFLYNYSEFYLWEEDTEICEECLKKNGK